MSISCCNKYWSDQSQPPAISFCMFNYHAFVLWIIGVWLLYALTSRCFLVPCSEAAAVYKMIKLFVIITYSSVCISFHSSKYVSIYFFICLFIQTPIYLSIYSSTYLSVYLSKYFFIYLSIYLSLYLTVSLLTYSPIYLLYIRI